RRLGRVRGLVEVGLLQQRRPDESGEDRHQRHQREQRDELADQQVRPGVDLVLGLGPGLLDRAGLDDGQEPLGVAPRPGGGGGRRGGGGGGGPAGGGGRRSSGGGRRGLAALLGRPAGGGAGQQMGGDLGGGVARGAGLRRRAFGGGRRF